MRYMVAAAVRAALGRVGLGVLVIAAPPVWAADEEPASAEAEGLAEVVVTANKRESTEQRTAVAMTVLGSDSLTRNGVGNLRDMIGLAPGVNLAQNSANMIVAVRGVSSRDTTEIGDPAVSISTDGFYVQRPIGFAESTYDLERVEVLRGPQGTLYGRNATGGAINFITSKPTNELAARASVTLGNYDLVATEGMANIPLSETVQTRVSVFSRRHSGYRTNEVPAAPGDDEDAISARWHLQYQPTEAFKALLTAQYTHVGGVGPTVFGVAGTPDNNVLPPIDSRGSPHGLPQQSIDATTKTVQLTLDYSFSFADLVYLGGYRKLDYTQLRDLNGTADSSAYFNPTEAPLDWSHELRLVSNNDGRFEWQVGGYYFTEENELLTYFQTWAVANSPVNRFVFDYNVKGRAEAAFGQASFQLTDTTKLSGGVRYSEDYKKRTGFSNTGGGNVPSNVDGTDTQTTYHVGFDWQAAPANLLYAKYDTGYKAGGFGEVVGIIGPYTYDPEAINAAEVGSKNRFFGNQFQLNISAFRYDYKDQQISVITNGLAQIINAGKSLIYGAEVEGSLSLGQGQLDASVAYLDAEFKDLCTRKLNGTCVTGFDFSGNTPPQAPRVQASLGLEYGFSMGGGTLTPRVQSRYESESFFGVENFARQRQEAYTKTDFMLTYAGDEGKWTVQGYVRNIEDEAVLTTAGFSGLWGTQTFGLAEPRTYGVRLVVSFL